MSETKTVTVPIGLTEQPPAQERPEWARKSLHNVKMGQTLARESAVEPQWGENPDGTARLSWRPPAPEPEPEQPGMVDHAHTHLSNLQRNIDAIRQYHNQTNGLDGQGANISAPNPLDYDLWDEQGAADFQKANDDFIMRAALERADAAIAPYRTAMAVMQDRMDFDALHAEHGEDPRFTDIMTAAFQLRNEHPEMSIPQAFEHASDPKNAKLGKKGNASLPAQLTKGKLPKFGQILLHNQMSGRSSR